MAATADRVVAAGYEAPIMGYGTRKAAALPGPPVWNAPFPDLRP